MRCKKAPFYTALFCVSGSAFWASGPGVLRGAGLPLPWPPAKRLLLRCGAPR